MIFASIVGLFRTILFILAFLLIMRFLIRYVLPLLARYFIGRTMRNMQQNQGNTQQKSSNTDEVEKKVGNVTIRFNPNKKKKDSKDKPDDYADFEVID